MRFEAYDGSGFGPADAPFTLRLINERGLRYLATAPGDLGHGPGLRRGRPRRSRACTPATRTTRSRRWARWRGRRPTPARARRDRQASWAGADWCRRSRRRRRHLPRWRRIAEGLRHSQDARRRGDPPPLRRVERVLRDGARPVDGLHLRGLPQPRRHASRRRRRRSSTWSAASSASSPGMRLLDVGCGWGGMVRHAAKHYGVTALGVTLSARAGRRGRRARSSATGCPTAPRSCTRDYRDAPGDGLRRGQLDRPDRAHRRAATTRRTSASCATSCATAAGCSTTASPGRTTTPG